MESTSSISSHLLPPQALWHTASTRGWEELMKQCEHVFGTACYHPTPRNTELNLLSAIYVLKCVLIPFLGNHLGIMWGVFCEFGSPRGGDHRLHPCFMKSFTADWVTLQLSVQMIDKCFKKGSAEKWSTLWDGHAHDHISHDTFKGSAEKGENVASNIYKAIFHIWNLLCLTQLVLAIINISNLRQIWLNVWKQNIDLELHHFHFFSLLQLQ